MPFKKSANPTEWKRAMVKGKDPICDSNPIVVSEPHRRRMQEHFDSTARPKGYVEDVDNNLTDAFKPVAKLNETECRTLCALYNHKHLRRNQLPLIQADLAYRKSLGDYGLCGNCEKPIYVKRSKIESGASLDSLTPKEVEYYDVPAHFVVKHRADNPKKVHYVHVPKTRVFNQRCTCGGEMREMLKNI